MSENDNTFATGIGKISTTVIAMVFVPAATAIGGFMISQNSHLNNIEGRTLVAEARIERDGVAAEKQRIDINSKFDMVVQRLDSIADRLSKLEGISSKI